MSSIRRIKDRWKPKWHLYLVVGLFIPVFCTVYLLKITPETHPDGDTPSYLAGAYNIMKYDTFSGERGTSTPQPQCLRTPAFSWFLAQGMGYLPGLRDADYGWFENADQQQLSPEFVSLKYLQLVLLLIIAALSAWLVLDITGSRAYAQWALWITAFHPFLSSYVNRLYSELFGVFVITVFTFLLYFSMKRRSMSLLLLAGAALGCVALTFSQWKYVAPVCYAAVLLYGLHVWGLRSWKGWLRSLAGVMIFVVGFSAVTYPWEMRNQRLFERGVISGRGGDILELRSHLDMMPFSTYLAAFCYWSRSPLLKAPLQKFVDHSVYALLDSDHKDSAYGMVERTRTRLGKLYPDEPLLADQIQLAEAKARILAHPVRHLLVSIPIAFRGMMDGTLSLFNLIVYFFFVYAFFASLRRDKWLIALVLAPAAGLLMFNALATHGHPRYSGQVVSVLWVGALAGLQLYLERRRRGISTDSDA